MASRESGLVVYGFGEKKTPEPFVSACDKFVYTEILRNLKDSDRSDESRNPELKAAITSAIDAVSRDDGWAPLSAVGSYINKNMPSFDPRNYGYDKLGKLVKSLNYLEIDERTFGDNSIHTHIYIRAKIA